MLPAAALPGAPRILHPNTGHRSELRPAHLLLQDHRQGRASRHAQVQGRPGAWPSGRTAHSRHGGHPASFGSSRSGYPADQCLLADLWSVQAKCPGKVWVSQRFCYPNIPILMHVMPPNPSLEKKLFSYKLYCPKYTHAGSQNKLCWSLCGPLWLRHGRQEALLPQPRGSRRPWVLDKHTLPAPPHWFYYIFFFLLLLLTDICRCLVDSMDTARRAYGTDEDIIFIYEKKAPATD